MGTYTGLCYPCEGTASFVATTYRDGAKQWSHPPHCPSHRRDRTGSIGYDDCPTCAGLGRTTYITWNSYPTCAVCATRFGQDSLRIAYSRRGRQIMDAAQNAGNQEMVAYRITHKIRKRGALPEGAEQEIWSRAHARWQHAATHLLAWSRALNVWS